MAAAARWSVGLGLALVIVGPALWIGGAWPAVVPTTCLVLAIAWPWLAHQRSELRVPWATWIGVWATAITLVQWLPFQPLRAALSPELATRVDDVMALAESSAWAGMTVVPGDTAVEVARVAALTVLFAMAAQRSWRPVATLVVVTGSLVALVGFVHEVLALDAIYGVYAKHEAAHAGGPWLLTSFVNPNHQSSLLMLGIFAAVALAVDQHAMAQQVTEPDCVDRHRDRALAAMAAVTVMLPALVLSLSRGALVVFAVIAPFAIVLGLRHLSRVGASSPGGVRTSASVAALGVVVLLGLMVVVAHHGALAELQTIDDEARATKLIVAGEATALIDLSLPLGIGRGVFVDVFAASQSDPSHVVFTHPESMPVALLVELGWLGGGVVIAGVLGWLAHAWSRSHRRSDGTARRIALLGIAAVLAHNGLEFSLELLGVAAPTVALAGALSPGRRAVPGRRAASLGVVVLVGVGALAAWGVPRCYAHRHALDGQVVAGTLDGRALLEDRPLDGRLHGLVARAHADAGRWHEAERWAESATTLRPGDPDAWLVLGVAQARLGLDDVAATRSGLARLHGRPDEALVEWLLNRYPMPAALAGVAPVFSERWSILAAAVKPRSPLHADAIAAARIAIAPGDHQALRLRHRIALERHQPALALHHARMWRAAQPQDGRTHVAVARALQSFSPPRRLEARDALVAALEGRRMDPAPRGVVEEELVRVLRGMGDEASLEQARDVALDLLSRPAGREVVRRRARLARPLLRTP